MEHLADGRLRPEADLDGLKCFRFKSTKKCRIINETVSTHVAGRHMGITAQVLRILVVDDVETMRKVTAGQLSSLGYGPVELASDGAEAWRMIERKRYDLVISDWNMPALTGIALLQMIRSSPRHMHMPFIMITAEAERSRIETAMRTVSATCWSNPTRRVGWPPASSARWRTRLHHQCRTRTSTRRRPPSPVDDVIVMPPAAVHLPPREPLPPTLLLVDDTADNLYVLANVFKGRYRIKAAHNGETASGLVLWQHAARPSAVGRDDALHGRF